VRKFQHAERLGYALIVPRGRAALYSERRSNFLKAVFAWFPSNLTELSSMQKYLFKEMSPHRSLSLIAGVVIAALILFGGTAFFVVAQEKIVRNHDEEGGVRRFHDENIAQGISRIFKADVEAREEFLRIVSTIGLSGIHDRITLRASAETDNAEAGIAKNGERFIFYNATFMQNLKATTGEHWTLVSILAHEIGHHLALHTELQGRWHEFELEADYFSGFVLRRLGASLDQSHAAMGAISPAEASLTHPGLKQRLEVITIGWTDGGSGEPPRGLKNTQNSVTGAESLLSTPQASKKPASDANSVAAPRIALVVGNSAYTHLPKLANAVLDAVRVTTELEQRGFRVLKALNVDRDALTRTVTEFENTLSIVGGTGLFYYAGQAVYINGEDVMLPIDARVEGNAIVGGLNLTQLMKDLQSRTAMQLKSNGTAVIYSASKGETAADGLPGGNSPLTTAFVRALNAYEAELSDTFRHIQKEMDSIGPVLSPGHRQRPVFESSLRSQYFIGQPGRDPEGTITRILIFDSCRDNPFERNMR
jgi:Caspase domain